MKPAGKIKRPLIDAVTMFLVSGLSLILLIYIGFGEAQRTYLQFHIEKLTAQGKVVQNAMESFLRPGLPLKQYVGFTTLTEPIIASDEAISSMAAFDRSGQTVFTSGVDSIGLLPATPGAAPPDAQAYDVRRTEEYYQVILPLHSRFETVGSLAITMPRAVVTERVTAKFRPLITVAIGLSIGFALVVAIGGPRLRNRRAPLLQIFFAVTFLAMAVFVIGTLIALYSEGAQSKATALANSLGQRLADAIEFNLNIDEFRGLNQTFGDYKRLNPDISAAGLTVNGVIKFHTDPERVGQVWVTSGSTYEYVVHLTPPESFRDIRVAVALPTAVVYRQMTRSAKNFTALFVASAFLAGLFLQLAGSMRQSRDADRSMDAEVAIPQDDDSALNLVKPVFFVAIFLEHLNYAFLPQFMYQVVATSGLSEGYASAPFMAYYLCFALALIPSGHFAQNYNARPLMYVGLLLAGAGLFILTLSPDFISVILARSLSGIGQGTLFIGVQSYILMMASPQKRTRGAAIIVFGFQGGMISGMAVGSLLVTYIGPEGVFTLSGIIAYALALYALMVVPSAVQKGASDLRMGFTFGQLARNTARALRSLDFLKTMLLIGIPAKAVLTGVVIFALPVLLAQKGYAQEDIGQIIMVYAAGVVVASSYASRLVDRTGQTYSILFWGAMISALGLFLTGLIGWQPLGAGPNGSTVVTGVLVAGVATVGIAHGFINAPVVTHIADSKLASTVGASSLTATYRFLERLGHIAGPIIIAQLFLFWGQSALLLSWIGVAVLLCAILFLVPVVPGHDSRIKGEIPG